MKFNLVSEVRNHTPLRLCKVSVNSGHPKTPGNWYISAINESNFGLKIWVLKHLPLG